MNTESQIQKNGDGRILKITKDKSVSPGQYNDLESLKKT
jgi:hypothetical protein